MDVTKLRISEYVNLKSGVSQHDDDCQPDHTYAKSSMWRPRNYLAKPCRHLYSSVARGGGGVDSCIDVETVGEEAVVPFPKGTVPPDSDPVPDDDAPCWSDKISKSGWSPVQIRILPKVLRIVEDVRLHRLALRGRTNEQFYLEDALNCSCSKLSNLLSSVGWDKSVTQWLHSLLMKHLAPVEREDYLAVLGLVKGKAGALVDRMVAPVTVGRSKDRPIECVFPPRPRLDQRVAEALLDEKFSKLPLDPVFFVIPNSLECAKTERFAAFIVQLRQMAYVHVLGCPPRARATVQQGLDQMMAESRVRLAETCSSFAGRPVVVIGWNVGAAIASLLAQLERVQAVICMGYPLKTLDGNLQRSSLSAVDMSCPVMFVMGSRSVLASQEEMEEMRTRMKVPNQLVVVGGCNDQLVMSHKERSLFCVTQSMVDRSLLVEVYNFVGEMLTQPPPQPPARPGPQLPVLRAPAVPYKKKCKRAASPPKRKPRAAQAQKLIVINSAKYMSLIPHHNYASKLQPILVGSQGYQRAGPPG